MKKSIGKSAVDNAMAIALPKTADLTAVRKVVDQEKPIKKVVEKRLAKIGSYVRPSEKEAFINLLGRKSESDAIRELILKFIEEKTK